MVNNKKNTPDSGGAVRGRSKVIVFTLLLLIASLSAGWLYYNSSARLSGLNSVTAQPTESGDQVGIGPMIDIREFIVNIISEDNSHYLRIAMAIEVSSEDVYEEMTLRMPQIRDAILMLASNKTFEELYDVHGKKQLKAELLLEINDMLTKGEAVAVYFTDFVVQ
ncbi:MAG: flagellar basal body-associated FliL family protein [Desulfocapsaceae bacterium]